jgi:antibiotic biosynthesis monooxygenase (ABM) superfamily enzyme
MLLTVTRLYDGHQQLKHWLNSQPRQLVLFLDLNKKLFDEGTAD